MTRTTNECLRLTRCLAVSLCAGPFVLRSDRSQAHQHSRLQSRRSWWSRRPWRSRWRFWRLRGSVGIRAGPRTRRARRTRQRRTRRRVPSLSAAVPVLSSGAQRTSRSAQQQLARSHPLFFHSSRASPRCCGFHVAAAHGRGVSIVLSPSFFQKHTRALKIHCCL